MLERSKLQKTLPFQLGGVLTRVVGDRESVVFPLLLEYSILHTKAVKDVSLKGTDRATESRKDPKEDSRRLLSGQAIHESEKKTGCTRSCLAVYLSTA